MNAPPFTQEFDACPCCGQSTATLDRPVVDVDGGFVTWCGYTAHIGRGRIAALAKILADRYPGGRSTDQLAFELWGGSDDEPETAHNIIYAYLVRIRGALRTAPFTIPRGYGSRSNQAFAFVRRDSPVGIAATSEETRRPGRPEGKMRQAVLAVFPPSDPLSFSDVRERLAARDVQIPRARIGHAIASLKYTGYIERVAHGYYRRKENP